MNYYFIYDTTTGAIYPSLSESAPSVAGMGLLGPYPQATASATVLQAYTFPTRFLAQGSPAQLVAQPYWTVTAAESTTTNGEYTLTATLNNPPSTPPSTATFSMAGGTISADVSSNQATATIQLHASVASQPVTVSVSASGTVSGSTTINSGTAQVGLQLITSGTTPLVAPVGAGSLAWLRAFYMGLTPENQVAVLTEALQNLAQSVAILGHFTATKVAPALQQATWAATDLSAEQAALTNWVDNVAPNLLQWPDLLDASGQPTPAYAELQAQAPNVLSGIQGYNTAVNSLPGLA